MKPLLPRGFRHGAAALCLACAGLAASANVEAPPPAPGLDRVEAVRASQAAIGRRVGDYTLLDRDARPVRLASLRGKPLLVSFVYTGCFQVCPATTRALAESVRALEARFGADRFNVVSIGFNQPADSPQALRAFAAQHGVARPNWHFLSPPARIVEPLARDFGFLYEATPAGFDHVLQLTLVDAEGRIAQQVYGDGVAADALGAPLQQLLAGVPVTRPGALDDLIERVRLLCTVYDPATGTYRVDYALALEVAGGLTFVLAVALYMLNEWRARRRARHAPHRVRPSRHGA